MDTTTLIYPGKQDHIVAYTRQPTYQQPKNVKKMPYYRTNDEDTNMSDEEYFDLEAEWMNSEEFEAEFEHDDDAANGLCEPDQDSSMNHLGEYGP